jgi:hypothetical protein
MKHRFDSKVSVASLSGSNVVHHDYCDSSLGEASLRSGGSRCMLLGYLVPLVLSPKELGQSVCTAPLFSNCAGLNFETFLCEVAVQLLPSYQLTVP